MRSACFCLFALPLFLGAQTAEKPVRAVTDPGVITTRQNITPAGVQAVFQGRVYGVAFAGSSEEVWALTSGSVYRMNWRANRLLAHVPYDGTAGLAGIRYDAASRRMLVTGARKAVVRLFSIGDQAEQIGTDLPGALAGSLAAGGGIALVPVISDNRLILFDLAQKRELGSVDTGKVPFGAVMNAAGTVAYVSNWGGRVPRAGDLTAPTGLRPDSDRVVVNERGIASTGSLTRIELASRRATHSIPVGLHPTSMAWDERRGRLYVANNNEDSISVVDTGRQRVVSTFALEPFGKKLAGVAPTALVLSGDGATLYAACGGLNAVAVLRASDGAMLGLIPTAWYPNDLALSPDGRYLAVSTLLGVGSGWRGDPAKRYVHAVRGSVHVVPVPDWGQLASYTTAVAENNHINLSAAARTRSEKPTPVAVPERSGDPSLIEHVVYIIKENRTYDQVFGGMEKGNGDPSLVMFGPEVTPNHHRLADQFVLLDNFYANGGNSGDGHQWVTQANETGYCLWPGYTGRSYPFDGSDPVAYSKAGFIWEAALSMKKTVRVYGEFAGRMSGIKQSREELLKRWEAGESFANEWHITAPIAPLNDILERSYPSYSTAIPDVIRARIFLNDLERWKREGSMPNLVILQLPSDHTFGTTPGRSSPKAMVADNDLAMGQIVDALSHSPFWKKMAIFVVEDDAQNGVDHVDGHRTVALVIGPYVRRDYVDSTMYSQVSMLKTIELILGLPSLSLFDLIANAMGASFTNEPDFRPYDAEVPRQSLYEVNPPLSALKGEALRAARDSMKMRFEVPDAAPTERLNRILWGAVRGWRTPYPAPARGAFAPLSLDLDDEDR
jgi:DNA-binding beta-propeller fold protein YncE